MSPGPPVTFDLSLPPPPPPLQLVGQRASFLVEFDELPQSLALDHRAGELGEEERAVSTLAR